MFESTTQALDLVHSSRRHLASRQAGARNRASKSSALRVVETSFSFVFAQLLKLESTAVHANRASSIVASEGRWRDAARRSALSSDDAI